ncbi:substrate-binding domain-containing protein [uncultured Cloacibacillus sp.]|uniref:sugar ABC transporter substrate-binding protein n=1 Tax=uncultured Cloacibacillus sp. TaxID=889794 RepID=UPI00260F67FC|nr:substrate-binding domain-containing protein [uncultured Cloacibacillus sp.]
MKRVMAAALAVFTAAGLLAGSAFAAQENARVKEIENTLMKQIGEMPKTGGGEKLGALVISLTNPYWVGMKDAYIAAAEQYGVNIEVMSAPTEGDKQSQLETLNAMALKDYKAIVLSPIEPYNLLPGIIQCNKNGIPVINLGPGINVDSLKEMGGRLDGRLTVDFAQQGELAASDMVKRIGTGKVAIIQGIPGAAQSEGRTAGAKKVFESTKGVELVSVQPANWDSTAAYNAASDIIQAHGDLKGIFCCNDVMALAASRALTDAGLKDKVLLYGVDGTEEAKTAIKEGRMDGTITYPSSAYAKAAVIMLLKLAQGMDMSQTVYCPLDVINTENVAQFDGYM